VYFRDMSQTRDKRRRSDLDQFVLALIAGGVSTPYDLQQQAGLSPGATLPALERLLQAGLVQAGKPGSRGKVAYTITRSGARSLSVGWRSLLEEGPSGDRDADLRVALLAVWIGGDRKAATEFLKQGAARKQQAIHTKRAGESGKAVSLADWYSRLRFESSAAMLQGEINAAFAMAKAFSRISLRKQSTTQST
jgi:DNA-binding PadR family transcriptional regulator